MAVRTQTETTGHDEGEVLTLDEQLEIVRRRMEKKFSCSLKVEKFPTYGEGAVPFFALSGCFVGSPLTYSRVTHFNVFPWEEIEPEFRDLLDAQFGKGKYYLHHFTLNEVTNATR